MTPRAKFMAVLGVTLIIGFSLGLITATGLGAGSNQSLETFFQNLRPPLSADQLANLDKIWRAIHDDYIISQVDDGKLMDGVLAGLVDGLGDPYSSYFTPTEAKDFQREIEGTFDGIGLELGYKNDILTVIAPLPNTPAAAAGIQPGDILVSIDGVGAAGMKLEEAVQAIRGPKGTKVTLQLLSTTAAEPRTVTIVRESITVDPVSWRTISNGDRRYGYIKIVNFNDQTHSLFQQAARSFLSQSVDGYIIDVRNNPGGLLDQSVKVISAFVTEGPAVIEEYRGGGRKTLSVDGSAFLAEQAVVMLVNGGSASASEIVAGALQDTGRATIIGTTTFGKGSVQDYRELRAGASLKLTIAKWLTPKGRSISEQGITPDIVVEPTTEDTNQGRDVQLLKAQEYLATQQ